MFKQFRNALFWHDEFDERWRSCSIFLKLPDIGWRWGQRIEEKRSYWREHGKKRRMTPNQAVFMAFEEMANSIFAEYSDREGMEATWLELAHAQHNAASFADWDEQWVSPENHLSDRWQSFYAAYQAKREEEQLEKSQRAAEVRSIWRHSGPPRKSAHEIASLANVSMQDIVFWMIILRENGFMSENIVLDEHLYCNQQSWLESRENLDQEKRLLLDRLADRQ